MDSLVLPDLLFTPEHAVPNQILRSDPIKIQRTVGVSCEINHNKALTNRIYHDFFSASTNFWYIFISSATQSLKHVSQHQITDGRKLIGYAYRLIFSKVILDYSINLFISSVSVAFSSFFASSSAFLRIRS